MTCRVSILDFDRQGLFDAATPESIANASGLWQKDIRILSPWTRIRESRLGSDSWVWHPREAGSGPAVFVCGSGTSTMDIGWHFIEKGQMTIWDSLISVKQSAGRGQHKRPWISPAGNIHASWYWPLPEFNGAGKTHWDGLLPLIAGFVFARVFKGLDIPVKIKWPNDLLITGQDGDRKVGGILVERRESHILAGIGINVNYSPEDARLREESAVVATHLNEHGYNMSPLFLWTKLVEEGKLLFKNLIQTTTPDEFINMIERQMAWVGNNVLIRQFNTDVFDAVILGLAKDGGLRIKKKNSEEVIYSGSIVKT